MIKKSEDKYNDAKEESDPAETRTLDPLIKSQLLYQLSYGVINYKNNFSGLQK